MSRRARIQVDDRGPGWATPEGGAARRLLRDAAAAVADVYRLAADDGDAILVGEAAKVARAAGATPRTLVGRSAAALVPVESLLRALAADAVLCGKLREAHAARGEGRAVVLILGEGFAVTRIVQTDVALPPGPGGAVAKGGDA